MSTRSGKSCHLPHGAGRALHNERCWRSACLWPERSSTKERTGFRDCNPEAQPKGNLESNEFRLGEMPVLNRAFLFGLHCFDPLLMDSTTFPDSQTMNAVDFFVGHPNDLQPNHWRSEVITSPGHYNVVPCGPCYKIHTKLHNNTYNRKTKQTKSTPAKAPQTTRRRRVTARPPALVSAGSRRVPRRPHETEELT